MIADARVAVMGVEGGERTLEEQGGEIKGLGERVGGLRRLIRDLGVDCERGVSRGSETG